MPFASVRSTEHANMPSKVQALEVALAKLDSQVKQHAIERDQMQADIVPAHAVKPSYVQNIETAAVHLIRPTDTCRTMCGYEFRGPTFRKRRTCKPEECFRFFDSLKDIPGTMMCSRCLPSERTMALTLDLLDADVSADEHDV